MKPQAYQKPTIYNSDGTKAQIGTYDIRTDPLTNSKADGILDYINNNLEALKAETYTKTEVDNKTGNYLPLSGGTMTGNNAQITMSNGESYIVSYGNGIYIGGSGGSNASTFALFTSSNGGGFQLNAGNGTTAKRMVGKPDGTFTWGGNNILTAANYNSYALPLSGGTLTGVVNGVTPPNDDNSKKLATTEFVNVKAGNYLPLSGGTINGDLSFTGSSSKINLSNGKSKVVSYGNGVYVYGDTADKSSSFAMFTNENGNGFQINAGNGTTQHRMVGKPDGTFTWDGQPIQTSSDKRLKQDFSVVPADVLESWSKVEWKQFKYIADKERKGDSCRWHTGLVAQDVQDVCGDKILKYGILCHDVKEATEDSEAVDLWTIRYEEALAMEVIYLRNEIKKLHEEIKALRTE